MPEIATFCLGVTSIRHIIGRGRQRMETSVMRLETELPIQRASTLIHWPAGMVRSQK